MSERITSIVRILKRSYPSSFFERSRNPFEVLISTVLSQRARDAVTFSVSERLFRRYPTAQALSRAPVKQVERLIREIGFYHVKAQRIIQISDRLMRHYRGKVPDSMDELIKLPGVGRKTAACVLVYAYRKPAIPVDTHVHRISNLIGLVKTKSPRHTEEQLMAHVPRRYWIDLNELLVRHGQTVCLPRRPRCEACRIATLCDYGSSSR